MFGTIYMSLIHICLVLFTCHSFTSVWYYLHSVWYYLHVTHQHLFGTIYMSLIHICLILFICHSFTSVWYYLHVTHSHLFGTILFQELFVCSVCQVVLAMRSVCMRSKFKCAHTISDPQSWAKKNKSRCTSFHRNTCFLKPLRKKHKQEDWFNKFINNI